MPLKLIARFFDMQNPTPTDLSCQLGAISAGCHADLAAEDLGQMALVGEASLLRNPDEGLMGQWVWRSKRWHARAIDAWTKGSAET